MHLFLIILFVFHLEDVFCLPANERVVVLRSGDHISNEDNRQPSASVDKSLQPRLLPEEEMIVVHRRKHVRRDLNVNEEKQGKATFFQLCVLKKGGKCLRKKKFGMWNSARGPGL